MQKKYIIKIALLGCILLGLSCKESNNNSSDLKDTEFILKSRYDKLVEYPLDSLGIPRSTSASLEKVIKVKPKDWTSGFFPGNLWLIYSLTKDERFKNKAIEWTACLEKEKLNDRTHDMGFKIFCSYGNGYQITDNKKYKDVILESAKTLSTRFNANVGAIRSWDFNKNIWEFPVIIDNMMNLELLFEATKISGDSLYHNIAVNHANKTLKNHVRKDNSTYHVVVYDTILGIAKEKITHQGFKNESSWSRGQAWCVYGFTMAYRYTKNKKYLDQAVATANFFINHRNLPKDGIPYWDFNDTSIPDAPKDVSAATIICSSFFELYNYTGNNEFLEFSKNILETLKSDKYMLGESITAPFILDHSTGNWPKNDEIDVPIVYADYYYLEALLRSKKYENK